MTSLRISYSPFFLRTAGFLTLYYSEAVWLASRQSQQTVAIWPLFEDHKHSDFLNERFASAKHKLVARLERVWRQDSGCSKRLEEIRYCLPSLAIHDSATLRQRRFVRHFPGSCVEPHLIGGFVESSHTVRWRN
jgi:hypothetical protein